MALLTFGEAADFLKLSKSGLRKLCARGAAPLPLRLGRSRRFDADELRQWVECGCPARDKWLVIRDARKGGAR